MRTPRPLLRILAVALGLGMSVGSLPVAAQAAATPDLRPATVMRRLDGLPAAATQGARAQGAPVDSQAVRTPIPFSMVGFSVPAGAALSFRTSADGESWGAWTAAPVEDDEGPDPRSAEAAAAEAGTTEGIWVGEARWLQTRVEGGDPRHADPILVDSSGLSRSVLERAGDAVEAAWSGTPANAATVAPAIVSRAQWGADERLRKGAPAYATVRNAIVHHTAGSNTYSQAQADDVMRGIYAYHVQGRGWSDVGYNFLVDRYGTVYEGRYGGMTQGVIGAQAGGFNTGSFGVSVMGSFDDAAPPAAAVAAVNRVLAWKFSLHGIDPNARITAVSAGSTKYSAGTRVSLPTIAGHRDVSATSCPGDRFYPLLSSMRAAVARQIDAPVTAPAPPPTGTAIERHYAQLGAARTALGEATSGEYDVTGGRARNFEQGRIYWSAATGAHATYGLIYDKFSATGSHQRWGLPTSDEVSVPGGRASTFQKATVYWSRPTGPRITFGAIRDKYLSSGGPARWGLPTGDEVAVTGGRSSAFQLATIYWSHATSARLVYGAIGSRYAALGGASSGLRLPTSDEYAVRGGRRSDFQGGSLTWVQARRSSVVTYR